MRKKRYENQPNPHCSSPFMVTISFKVCNLIFMLALKNTQKTMATSMLVTDVGDKFEKSVTDLRF